MNTIQYVVDGLRELIRQVSDDSVFSDEFLYHQLNNVRIQIMRQYMNDKKPISPWLYQRFCIKLCPSTFMECNCESFNFGCTVWRSEKPIPQPLTTDAGLIAEFSELNGDLITQVTENTGRMLRYRKVKRRLHYLIGDVRGEKYLFVISEEVPPKFIKVNTVLIDPIEAQYAQCTDDDCPIKTENLFPIEPHLLNSVYRMALENMGISMSMFDDRSNNSEGAYNAFRTPQRKEEG